jgi:hypothetical protein
MHYLVQTCRASIRTIITEHLQPIDIVTLLKFEYTVKPVFAEFSVQNRKAEMLELIATQTECGGGTSFYDAIMRALEMVPGSSSSSSSNKQKSKGISVKTSTNMQAPAATSFNNKNATYDHWICALTDGDDNGSRNTVASLTQPITASIAHVVFITVGPLSNAASIKRLAQCASRNGRTGLHIPATGNATGIQQAFSQVAVMLGNVHMETL